MIGAVLIHDRKALHAFVQRTALGDIDDARIEIAVLAGDALVDRVRDDMRDTAPVGAHGRIDLPSHLLLAENSLGDEGVAELKQALATSTSIVVLDLAMNNIT